MAEKLAYRTIGLRAQEFHEGLKDITGFGPKEAHLEKTILIGKTASLSTHLKGLNFVEDIQALKYLGAELGISALELEHVLRELEEIDFATVVKKGSEIKRVELRIPELRDGYEDLGERWADLKPGEMENAALHILEDVASFPKKEEDVQKSFGIGEKSFDTILTIGRAGALIAKHISRDGESVLFSPLTVEETPDAALALAKKFPHHRVIAALKEVRSQQGIPLNILESSDPEVVTEAVLLGILCPVQIAVGSETRTFLFSPRGALRKEEKIILEKARAILACVRCGEHFAKVRRIRYPLRILETLRDKKTFRYSRPDVPEQYGLLVRKQIGFIKPDRTRNRFFNFHFLDTPENLHALDIAIDLLELGQSSTSKLETDVREFLNISGSFSGNLPTRSRMTRNFTQSREDSRDIIHELSKLARGVIQ